MLVKGFSFAVKLGIEQRDEAIRVGALGATTLLFNDGNFTMPSITNYDSLKSESHIYRLLIDNLNPEQDDVIIIGSDNEDRRIAELAAKNAVLKTIMDHDRHNHVWWEGASWHNHAAGLTRERRAKLCLFVCLCGLSMLR